MATRKKSAPLKKVSIREVDVFRIANRKGFAAVCRKHLTEGTTVYQAYSRLVKACRRNGLDLPERKASELKFKT